MKLFKGRVVSFKSDEKAIDIPDGYIIVDDMGKIIEVGQKKIPSGEFEVLDFSEFVIFPGFFDIHVHLPQFDQRARWGKNLLEWLEHYIFPAEQKFARDEVARDTARRFFNSLVSNGTTTAVVYSSAHRSATEIAFEEARKIGIRALIGQVLMDRNAPFEMLTTPGRAKKDIEAVASQWHGYDDRLFYVVTPRFAISCSMELMKAASDVAAANGLYIQSHLSEQIPEVEFVRELFPDIPNYTSVYHAAGLLGEKTIMAHAIHLSDDELELLRDTGTKIAHCPSSNFFLHSGRMDMELIEKYDLDVGVGSDVAGGPFINMLEVLRDAYYANRISPIKAFYHLTLGGAKVLGWETKVGTIEPGREADFTIIDPRPLASVNDELTDVLAKLMFLGDDRNVVATFVRGKQIWHK